MRFAVEPRSLGCVTLCRGPFLRRECLDRQRVNLAAHARAQRSIYELVTRNAALSRELRRDEEGLEVSVRISAATCSAVIGGIVSGE